ncbi:MAG TPA: TIGR01458 family HAD-type hydrolase [Methylophilaceae bacterium]|nr:TIGR01458 family HAD-type hydrolase [Methylophilaceae bacterium]
MQHLKSIKGILFDLDGVLYINKTPIAGAIEAVEKIRSHGYRCRFITNTSTLSTTSIRDKINAMGFNVVQSEIMSAPQAAVNFLEKQADPVCRLLLADDVKKDFSQFPQSETAANFIVIGDIGNRWSYDLLNEVFSCLMNGAKLIAIHKNRFWQTASGLHMDIGAFIAGLEYASNTEAMIIGKPSPEFFNAALSDMQLNQNEVLMIGDDIDSDIGGAQESNIKGILVRTGKYRKAYADASSVKPYLTIKSIADLPKLLVQ